MKAWYRGLPIRREFTPKTIQTKEEYNLVHAIKVRVKTMDI